MFEVLSYSFEYYNILWNDSHSPSGHLNNDSLSFIQQTNHAVIRFRGLTVKFLICSKIGEEQSPEDAEDGPPELLVSPAEAPWSLIVVNVTLNHNNDNSVFSSVC